jgi:hypothetical protein
MKEQKNDIFKYKKSSQIVPAYVKVNLGTESTAKRNLTPV